MGRGLYHVVSIALCLAAFAPIGAIADYGPHLDVKAVRDSAQLQWHCTGSSACKSVTEVTVVEDYAVVNWRAYHSGGQALWQKKDGRWRFRAQGGGVMGVTDLERYGVPPAVAAELVNRER